MPKRLTIEYVREQIEREDYKLLTKEYRNNKQKLECICPRGHKYNVSWNDWKQKHSRCPCRSKYNNRYTIEFIRSEFAKEDYILLATEYVNNSHKLECICSRGHKYKVTWNNWKSHKQRCPYCSKYRNRYTIEFIRSEFAKEGYKFLTKEYINAQQKLDYICPKGHRHSISWNKWKQGERCPEHANIISKGEIEVRNFIKFLGIEVSPNDRNQIFNPNTEKGLELDIFMPTFNKAVEYNGEYWHRDKKNRINNDLLKQKLCKDKNIDLLVVTDKEWNENIKKCKSKIISFIGN